MRFMHGVLHVCLTGQAAAVQMLEWQLHCYKHMSVTWHAGTNGRPQWMLGALQRKKSHVVLTSCKSEMSPLFCDSGCRKVLEQCMLLFKNALPPALEPVACHVCTDHSKPVDSRKAQPWSTKTKVNQDYLLKKIVPVPGSIHILPRLSMQLLGWP